MQKPITFIYPRAPIAVLAPPHNLRRSAAWSCMDAEIRCSCVAAGKQTIASWASGSKARQNTYLQSDQPKPRHHGPVSALLPMKYQIILLRILLLIFPGITQAQLQPFIGPSSLPADSTIVCTIPWYLGSFYTSGFAEGAFANDFKLYGLNGDSLQLAQKLAIGKPVLLIGGSLTCPVFRNKVPTINQVISTYGSQVQVFVVYTLEAHPTDTSVYFGAVNITNANQSAGILFPQPTTYGQRKHLADTMSNWVNLNAPVFLDGPCNHWWSTFGPAPNNAYLIDTNGQIVAKHGWFHKDFDNIFCDIDSLLGTNSGLCTPAIGNGSFQLQVLNQYGTGPAGSIVYDHANLINTGNTMVSIGVKKIQKNHPVSWQTAFCADVCYSTSDDSITLNLAPNDTLPFSLDFFTGVIPDSGSVKVGFRNLTNLNNNAQVTFRASTFPAGILDSWNQTVMVYPNPARDAVTVKLNDEIREVRAIDIDGRSKLLSLMDPGRVSLQGLNTGFYVLELSTDRGKCYCRVLKH